MRILINMEAIRHKLDTQAVMRLQSNMDVLCLPIDCGDCSMCCRFRDDGVPLSTIDAINELDFIVQNGGLLIRKHEDGSCVYLDGNKCALHDTAKKPLVCVKFDCRLVAILGEDEAREALGDCYTCGFEAIYKQGKRKLNESYRELRKR